MKPLATNPSNMPRSGIREIMELASELGNIIHLEVGEPDFDTPKHIVNAAISALGGGYTKYTPNAGITSLRKEIANKLRTSNGIGVSLENVVLTTGAVGGLTSSIIAVVEPGEEVLIPDPGWPNYESATRLIGAFPRAYPLDPQTGFLPDMDSLESLLSERTKMILINSPSNPTGAVFPEETVKVLVDFASKHDLYILSDEVYEHIIFEGEHISPALFDSEGRVITVMGFSKSYAMTGWRLGYVVAEQNIASVVVKLQEPLVSCVFGVSQRAGEAALLGPQDCVRKMRDSYRRRRDMAVRILESNKLLSYVPRGAFYILIDISTTRMESYEFAKNLIRECRVAVAPGGTFGKVGESYVRVSLATEEGDLKEGLDRICSFIRSRNG
jgi:aspartate/methionine/tyrosine aminotransferase